MALQLAAPTRRLAAIVAALLVALPAAPGALAGGPAAPARSGFALPALQAPAPYAPRGVGPTDTRVRVDAALALRSLVSAGDRSLVTRSDGGAIEVAVSLSVDGSLAAARSAVLAAGGSVANDAPGMVEAYVPPGSLAGLAASPSIYAIEPIRRRVTAASPEGAAVTLLGADPWHAAGYTGAGIRIGIIDGGFSAYANLMGSAFAATVQARCYTAVGHYTANLASCDAGGEDHGTAVAETIASVAPGASLYIADPISPLDERSTVAWMLSQGVRIINASWTSGDVFEGPGDGTSPYPDSHYALVDQAVAGGALWVNAAGNDGQEGWLGPWTDVNANGLLEFAAGDESDRITLHAGEDITAALRWDDPWGASSNDLDLYLYRGDDTTPVASSTDPQDGTGDPLEVLDYRVRATDTYRFQVKRKAGTGPSRVQLLVGTNSGEPLTYHTGDATLPAPADGKNPGMVTVGAVNVLEPGAVEPYSGSGPTVDGRQRPDLVAPDCTETLALGQFCGTSQATPFVSGVAAMLLEAQPGLSPADLAAALRAQAGSPAGAGPGPATGSGLLVLTTAPSTPPAPPGPPPTGTVTITQAASAAAWQALAASGQYVHLAYSSGSSSSVAYQRSADGGGSFGAVTTLSERGVRAGPPSIAAAGHVVAVAWQQRGLASVTGLWARVSPDDGVTWGEPVRLTPARAGLPSVAVDDTGRVLVAWTDAASGLIVARASGDAGASFASARTLGKTTRRSAAEASAYEGGVSTAFGQGVAYVTWAGSGKAILARTSPDGGTGWQPITTVDAAAVGAVEPWVAAAGAGAVIVYAARRTPAAAPGIYLRRSADAGAHWTARRVAASGALPLGAPVATIAGARLRLGYSQCTTSACTRAILRYVESANGGASWTAPTALTPATGYSVGVGILAASRVLVLYTTATTSAAPLAVLGLRIR